MTSPTPPPGWHPDPSEPGLLRYWDGTQWTEHTQSAAELTAAANISADPAEVVTTDEPGRTGVPRAVKIVGGIVAAFVVIGVLGAVFGDEESSDDSDAAAPQPTSSAAAPQVTTPAPLATTTNAPATTTAVQPTTTTPAPAAGPATYTSDPRCAPANQSLVDQVTAGFSESGLTLTNGTVIDAGEYTYVGGTTVDAAGRVENRSDVWVISKGPCTPLPEEPGTPRPGRRPARNSVSPPVILTSKPSTPASWNSLGDTVAVRGQQCGSKRSVIRA